MNSSLIGKAIIALLLVPMALVSCCKDDDPVQTPDPDPVEEIKDDEAGTFKVTNLSTGNDIAISNSVHIVIGKTIAMCYGDDTLKLKFEPKDIYRDCKFDVQCEELTKLNDSLFVVPEGKKVDKVSNLQLDMTATCSQVVNNVKMALSAKQATTVSYKPAFYFGVNCRFAVSPDLLLYVTPELTYVDKDGNQVTKVLTDAEMEAQTSKIAVYEDQEGNKHEIYEGIMQPQEGWTKVDEYDMVLSKHYYFESALLKRGTYQLATVKYYRKENVELSADHCDFNRSINWGAPGYMNVSISITQENTKNDLSKAQKYLDEILSKPDVLTLAISKEGDISNVE